ncbi:MAG: Ser-Thr-rich glycosyl-phosphatidyl-inositol-anchored membrane family protein [candidate division TA06 bacterium ADurb.Bin417]|uniref:Ser-Thr-rich glycosyl-phosphatidyl-inositol-anchored membrane family protein n=1 Tax=candidate division TA06 bacterium ADurb.Bin417 TaxID=1852828 RepID=A0A1V5MIR4_UNCT6|nr:MAG: Ser-Thr-rich glycosyl-phosphatidyl-inositol-anchored membrane family protein [candidate division TA06 bacterium ADurb.Bin417]
MSDPAVLPLNDLGDNTGYDFFLTVRTNPLMPDGQGFRVILDDVVLTDTTGSATQGGTLNAAPVDGHLIFSQAELRDLLAVISTSDYSIPAEMSEPGKDYLLKTDQALLLSRAEYADYVFGFNLSGNAGVQTDPATYRPEAVSSLRVTFKSGGSFDPEIHLAALSDSDPRGRGVVLYRDNGDGVFNVATDSPLVIDVLRGTSLPGYSWATGTDTKTLEIFLDTTYGGALIPPRVGGNADYFLVLRTGSDNLLYGGQFKTYLRPGDLKFEVVPDQASQALSIEAGSVQTSHLLFAASDLTSRYIDPQSELVSGSAAQSVHLPIIGLNLAKGTGMNVRLQGFKVYLKGPGLELNDLLPVGGTSGGLQLWQDNKVGGRIGIFDTADPVVNLQSMSWFDEGTDGAGNRVFSARVAPLISIDLYDNDTGSQRGDDLFVTLRLSSEADYGDTVLVELRDGEDGVLFTTGSSAPGFAFLSDSDFEAPGINPIQVNVPVILSDISTGQLPSGGAPQGVAKLMLRSPESGSLYLRNLVVQIVPGTGFNLLGDLADIVTTVNSGLTLWQDNGDGVFSPDSDTFLPLAAIENLSAIEEDYLRYRLTLLAPPAIPAAQDTAFFLAVRTTSNFSAGDSFQVRLWSSNIEPERTRAFNFSDAAAADTCFSFQKIITRLLVGTGVLQPYLSIGIINPAAAGEEPVRPDNTYNITWQPYREGPGVPTATVSLYYFDVGNPTDRFLIAAGLPYTTTSYLWSTRDIPQGSYRIYAEIREGQAFASAISNGSIDLSDHAPAVTIVTPSQPRERAIYDTYTVRWQAFGLDSQNESLQLAYVDTAMVVRGTIATVNLNGYLNGSIYSTSWNTSAVPDGVYYIRGVINDALWSDTGLSTGTVEVNHSVTPPARLTVTEPAGEILLDGGNDEELYPDPLHPQVLTLGATLTPFTAADRVLLYDTWGVNVWDGDDAIWLDLDGSGTYSAGDLLLAGVAPHTGEIGAPLSMVNPFVYNDANGNGVWTLGEHIYYEGGLGNQRFKYSNSQVDISWVPETPGALAPTNTYIRIMLDRDGLAGSGDEIAVDTLLVPQGAPLAGSYTYDFSQLTLAEHGTYRVLLQVNDVAGWYPGEYYFAPGPVTVNGAPQLAITTPDADTDVWNGYLYSINFNARDPDDNATVNLYLYDDISGDTYLISGNIREGTGLDTFVAWNPALTAAAPRNYYLQVRGTISDGNWSSTVQAPGRVRILNTVPKVVLSGESNYNDITLRWYDQTPTGDVKRFILERWTQPDTGLWQPIATGLAGDFNQIATGTYEFVDDNPNIYADRSLRSNYQVRVLVTTGTVTQTFISNTFNALPLAFPLRPESFEVVPGTLQADLRWTWDYSTAPWVTGFIIERRPSYSNNFVTIGMTNTHTFTDLNYNDSMLMVETDYQYRVRAYLTYPSGNVGYSAYSSTLEVEIVPTNNGNIGVPNGGGGGGGCFIATAGLRPLLLPPFTAAGRVYSTPALLVRPGARRAAAGHLAGSPALDRLRPG